MEDNGYLWKVRDIMDSRIVKLADLLVNYSCKLQAGEKVLIECEGDTPYDLVRMIIRKVYEAKGVPFVNLSDSRIKRELLLSCTEEQLKLKYELAMDQMKHMDAYIAIRAGNNSAELSDVSEDNIKLASMLSREVTDYRVNKTKWVILRYPNNSMAQLANMSLEAFEDFYFNVCTLDYSKMSRAMDSLKALMDKTDKVRLVAQNTDLTFSIKGIPAIKCDGERNIPDGEVYTAPVRDSINGKISYNTPSEYQGFKYENISFEIENGKIVKATANNEERINNLLDTDEGARYFGEFAIGVNPFVLEPMLDILFDEKIAGSFHFTPGMAYEDANNGNKSAIHWDLVMIQRPEYGGGEIWFDDKLIRKDGMFVIDELKCLNPENLK